MAHTDQPRLFDGPARRRNLVRAEQYGTGAAFLIDEVASRLADSLADVARDFTAILDVGGRMYTSGNGFPVNGTVTTVPFHDSQGNETACKRLTDNESLPVESGNSDLVVSNLSLHAINDLPGLLIQINRALKPDGLFMASLFGGETLHELRHALLAAESEITGGAHPRIAPMADVRDLGSLLQRAGFALPVADMDTITVTYDHPVKLMHDLRAMGEANCLTDRSHHFMRRDVLMRACALYSDRHGGADGRIPATFQIVYLTGWHPDESQPQPLKPGSGKVSLSSALKSAIGKEEKT